MLPATAHAQTPPSPPPNPPPNPVCDGTLCAAPLRKGDVAPFAGQLLTVDLALRLGQRAGSCEADKQAAVQRCRDDAAIDLKQAIDSREADKRAFEQSLQEAQQRLARAEKLAADQAPPWFAQPWFVGPAAAVITAGVVVWALHH